MNGQFHALTVLPPRKEPMVSLGRRFTEPQNQSERSGEETNSLLIAGVELWIVECAAYDLDGHLRE